MGLLVGIVAWIGPSILVRQFAALRWSLLLIFALGLVKHLLRTLAWKQALKAEGVDLGYRDLLRVRVGSQALAYLSSMGLLVSEPLKPWLLRKAVAIESTIPATMVEAGVYWFTSLFVTTVGFFVALHMMADQQNTLLFAIVWLATFCAALLLLFMRSPLLPKLERLIRRRSAPRPRWLAALGKAGEMEAQMRSFRLRHVRVTIIILGLNILVQVAMFTEVWVTLSAIGVAIGVFQIAAIEAASRMVKMVSFYLPGRLGADEAGAAGSFMLLGLDPAAGLTLAIVRRVQGLFWAAFGLTWLSRSGAAPKLSRSAASEGARPGSEEVHPAPADDVSSDENPREKYDAGACLVTQD